jgi:uncharacterized protein YjiK
MAMKRFFLLFQLAWLPFWGYSQLPEPELLWKRKLNLPEPSDLHINGNDWYIVSDNGLLYRTDTLGNALDTAAFQDYDFEGVTMNGRSLVVMEESLRRVHVFTPEGLKLTKTVPIQYTGGRNAGFESISWDAEEQVFYAFTEHQPCLLYRFSASFEVLDEQAVSGIQEVSAVTIRNGRLWVLSDEARTVYLLNPSKDGIEASWKLPVINPEGMAFDATGRLFILSDDRATLYCFSLTIPQP